MGFFNGFFLHIKTITGEGWLWLRDEDLEKPNKKGIIIERDKVSS